MNIQSLHVSQLYESAAAFGVLVLLVAQILAFTRELCSHAASIRIKQNQQQEQWIRQKFPHEEDLQGQQDLQKSVIESLRREMTAFEQKNVETSSKNSQLPVQNNENSPEQPKPATIQVLAELNPTQKSTLLFYIQYNNFMSEHVPIIFALLVLGMLTNSTRIFSLASFFCYLFCSLIFDFLHLQERLKAQYKKGFTIRRLVKILSSLFVLGLFISYWALGQFDST